MGANLAETRCFAYHRAPGRRPGRHANIAARKKTVGETGMGYRIAILAPIAAMALCAGAAAQTYPERPIEVTVPFSPGAVTDVLGRALAEGLGAALGQRAIVVNKAGATGAIGTAAVARGARRLLAPVHG